MNMTLYIQTSRKKLITFECCTDDTYDAGNATSVDPIRKLAVNLEELRIQNCACHCTIDASYVDVNDNGQETIEKTNHKSKNNIDEAQSVEVQLRLDQKDEVTKVQQQAIERLESEQLNLEEPMNTDDDEAANIVDHVHANDQNQQLDEKFSICGETVIIDNASTSSIEILNDSVKYVNDVSGQCNMNKMMDRSNEQAPDTDNVMLDENGQTMFDDPLPDITEIFKQMVISRKFIPNSMVLEIGLEYKNILWHILQSKDEPAKHLNQWKRYYMFWKIMLVYMKEEHKKAMAIFDDLKAVLNKDHHGKHLFSEIALQLRCLGGEDDASPEIDRLRSHGGKIIRDL